MRRIPIPNNNSPNEFGVELDKKLTDGSKAIGVVRITDTQSPYNPEEILLTIEAWQVGPEGRPYARQPLTGQPQRVGIRPLIVSIPRSQYTHEEAEKQINIAAAALALEAGDPPAPVSLPNPPREITPAAAPAQLPPK
jgi:hypothetical protein